MRFRFMLTRVTIIKKATNSRCWWRCEKIGILIMASRNLKRCSHFGEVGQLLKRLSMKLPYYPAILLLGTYPRDIKNICPHKNMYMNVQSSIVLKRPQNETTQMFVDWWMDKYNEVYPCKGILFSYKKNEGPIHTTTWMDLETLC